MKKSILKLVSIYLVMVGMITVSCKKEDNNENSPSPSDSKETSFIENEIMNSNNQLVEKTVTVKDFGEGIGTIKLKKDITYILDGLVFVNDGQTLTIEAGTVIKGKPGQERDASALVVARGGKIMAEGSKNAPIIFCAEADDTHYNHQMKKLVQGENIPYNSRGLWGGLIVLGKGSTNNATVEKAIEGIPTEESRGKYGGNDDNDNSGILKYISIRNGGTDIGQGNEINGLTLGAVGSKTTVEYIEVIGNKDDGFEWFGSTVTCKHLVSAYNGDDNFDYDESFRGYGQFWLAIQGDDTGERAGEHDGAPKDNYLGSPYAIPHIYNVTYIGNNSENELILFRDNAGGHYLNSIFMSQPEGINLEWIKGNQCSYTMFEKGMLSIKYNSFWNIGNNTLEEIFGMNSKNDDPIPDDLLMKWRNSFEENGNMVKDPGIDYMNHSFVPVMDVSSSLNTFPEEITPTNYKGAFDPQKESWIQSWTKLSQIK